MHHAKALSRYQEEILAVPLRPWRLCVREDMRGEQLARQWRILRAVEASPNGLAVTEVSKREESGPRTVYRDLVAPQQAGFPLYTERMERANRWMFVDTFKFKVPQPFTFTKLMALNLYGGGWRSEWEDGD